MADSTLAALSAATDLDGSELLYAVQGGADKKATTDQLIARSRKLLTANTTYYVDTTGSDGNDGSSGAPWATLQHAIDYINQRVDFGGYSVTVQLVAGTIGTPKVYDRVVITNFVGGGTLKIYSSDGVAASTKIDSGAESSVTLDSGGGNPTSIVIGGIWLASTTGGCVRANGNADCQIGSAESPNVKMTCTANFFITAIDHATLNISPSCNLEVDGGSFAGFGFGYIRDQGLVDLDGTWTITGNPNWSTAFIDVERQGNVFALLRVGSNVTGSSTGRRYRSSSGSFIEIYGLIAEFPGDTAGTVENSTVEGIFDGAPFGGTYELGKPSIQEGSLVLSGTGSVNTTTIKSSPSAAASRTYILPPNFGAPGSVLTDVNGDGVLSWVVP